MAHSIINIVSNVVHQRHKRSYGLPNKMLFQSVNYKFLSIYTKNSVADCLAKANGNGAHNFNIFLSSENLNFIPKGILRKM